MAPVRWRARPLLGAAVCVGLGIAAGTQWPAVGFVGWAGLVGAAVVAAALVAWSTRQRLVSLRRLGWTACVALALVGLGGARLAVWDALPPHHVAYLAEEADALPHTIPLTVTGRVVGPPTATERRLRFVLAADSVGLGAPVSTTGRVEVTVWPPFPPHGPAGGERPPAAWPEVRPGDRVAVVGQLRPPPGRRNPADFDYGAYLRRQGLRAVVSASDSAAVTVLATEATARERTVEAARQRVRASLAAHVRHDDARGVLQALLLADRTGIARETREAFALTGLAHLLAVSGLHVFLVGMVLYGVLKPFLHRFGWAWRRVEVARAVLTILLLAAYVGVVGAPASATRALVMATLLVAGRALGRPSNGLNALGAAGLLLLLIRPTALFDVGFQLSFAAVGGLILLIPTFERRIPLAWMDRRAARWALGLVLASAAATVATMPVLLYHFGRVPLAGVLLNLAAIPATALALTGGLLVVLLAGWAEGLASAAGATAEVAAWAVLATGAEGVRWLGWTAVAASVRDGWALAAIVVAVATVAVAERPRLRWRGVLAATALAAMALWMPLRDGGARPTLDVLFFDVGQGDAALLRLPNGRHLLVDAGPRDPYGDAGARTLLPHLARYGVRRLDAVVVSHPHADHLGGVPALLEAGVVHRVLHSGENFASELYAEKEIWAEVMGVPLRALAAGDTLALDPAVRIHALHPGPEPDAHTNDASVVLLVAFGETAWLFTGDVETEAEATLAARYGDRLCADVVKVAHHGSRTSSTPPFVEAAGGCGRTRFAVASLARRNRHGHPDPDALARWRAAGAEVLTTAEEGAVWLRSDGRSVWRVRWR